jgi:hypothetical protein
MEYSPASTIFQEHYPDRRSSFAIAALKRARIAQNVADWRR